MAARILIADPDASLTDAYRARLTDHGLVALVAADGVQCVRLLRQTRVDVLFLSASLPWGGCDGVLAVLQEEPGLRPSSVVVLISAAERYALYRVAPHHIDDYQFKPFSPERLVQYTARLLAEPAACACPANRG